MKYNSGIYKITNKINGKMYIGSSSNLSKRKSLHFKQLKSGQHFNLILQRSFNKHGADNFIFEIIEYIDYNSDKLKLREVLIEREQHWLDIIKPYGDVGYNILTHAGSNLGKEVSLETREKLRKLQLGRVRSKETRKKISMAQKNRVYKPLSTEHKEKISKATKGRGVSIENKVFYSMLNRQYKHTDKARKKISSSLMGNKRRVGCKLSEEHKNSLRLASQVSVINIDTKEIFGSLVEAAKFYNIKSKSGISMCCSRRQKTCGGYKWAYLKDYKGELNDSN